MTVNYSKKNVKDILPEELILYIIFMCTSPRDVIYLCHSLSICAKDTQNILFEYLEKNKLYLDYTIINNMDIYTKKYLLYYQKKEYKQEEKHIYKLLFQKCSVAACDKKDDQLLECILDIASKKDIFDIFNFIYIIYYCITHHFYDGMLTAYTYICWTKNIENIMCDNDCSFRVYVWNISCLARNFESLYYFGEKFSYDINDVYVGLVLSLRLHNFHCEHIDFSTMSDYIKIINYLLFEKDAPVTFQILYNYYMKSFNFIYKDFVLDCDIIKKLTRCCLDQMNISRQQMIYLFYELVSCRFIELAKFFLNIVFTHPLVLYQPELQQSLMADFIK